MRRQSLGTKLQLPQPLQRRKSWLKEDIKGDGFPAIGPLKRHGKFYVRLIIDEEVKTTMVNTRGDAPVWNESFYFEASGSSILELHVYAQRKFGGDDHIGGMKGTIESLLAQGHMRVISGKLSKLDSKGILRGLQATVEFTITSEPLASSADSEESQMDETVGQAIDSLKQMKPGPYDLDLAVNKATIAADADAWDPLLEKIELLTTIVDKLVEVHPYAKMAWSVLAAAHKIIFAQKIRDENIEHLAEVMNDVYAFVHEADAVRKIKSQKEVVARMAQQTTECAYFIRHYANKKSFWSRTLNNLVSGVDNKIKLYEKKFKEIKSAFHDRAALYTEITVLRTETNVLRTLDIVEKSAVDADLKDMLYARGAGYNPEKECLPKTREAIIDEIIDWVNRSDGDDVPRLFLLSGVAGSGKSAIAHTVARRFDEQKRLGSSFCFDRSNQAERRPDNVFSTIAVDLADLDAQWKIALWDIVKNNRTLRTTSSIQRQFENFLLKPADCLTTIGPIVIVIDALDESGDQASREKLLTILAKRVSDLPSNFRILITTRPEVDIQDAFNDTRLVFCKDMDTIDAKTTRDDISIFVETQLANIPGLELEWPDNSWCRLLVEKSEGLFQWAFTACKAIQGHNKGGLNPRERLRRIISSVTYGSELGPLDRLYLLILEEALDHNDSFIMSRFNSIMGRVLAAKEPLSLSTLNALRCEDEYGVAESLLRPLGSLLSGVTQHSVPVRPLHTSFRDFLTDVARSGPFYIDISLPNQNLALASLQAMKTGLRFNICGIETSHLKNTDVFQLSRRIEAAIPAHLTYACRYWADHLQAGQGSGELLSEVRDFIYGKFPYWLEVLSLIDSIPLASPSLLRVTEWSKQVNDQDPELVAFLADARRFIFAFKEPISHSVPHIYLSALSFAPRLSKVSQLFQHKFPQRLTVLKGKLINWPTFLYALEGHTGVVRSVLFSLDGKRIFSGSDDCTIRTWHAEMGNTILRPFRGHTDCVNCVAFSPDNNRIVSGSDDRMVRVWDAKTGDMVIGPLKGHTSWIWSVAFSPDGMRIVSGSKDHTIMVWDARTGAKVAGPFKGHTDVVRSVSFSFNGKRIISGSDDWTIRTWDAETGDTVLGPFNGHTDCVNSVMFSPDGNRIVSGSDDETIRIWDAETGNTVVGPFKGHSNDVFSVAFSPDGNYIVSGSRDKTIRVWNVETGNLVSKPFTGHTKAIWSVAFSPDGKYIVSGSADKTIRIWDIEAGSIVSSPLKGHTSTVRSVAFSLDGNHIISGSDDWTIRTWEVEQVTKVSGPFNGHTDCVNCIALSPDGNRVASGSDDQTIWVWDSETGSALAGPFKGHTNWIWSVAFSPDGKHIVSGSKDQTIRVWDAGTGEMVAGPFKGHTDTVRSVMFTLDCKRIFSGSDDRTIRSWDVETDGTELRVFKGHTKCINSIAFSPEGERIVSGSDDQTIRIWDAETGDTVAGPFKGHTNFVLSVVFLPDGKRVVSGSKDHTIRIWDAETGDTVSSPLKGHTDAVWSVAVSPDGQYIVSGSTDLTIRVWDAETGDTLLESSEGHADIVRSVLFSRDGKHITSGSEDWTIRTWDAETGNTVLGPLTRHEDCVNSISLSPDGSRIVSGSDDQTIWIWDAETGDTIVGPFKGHTSWIWSVAFSPDGKRIVSGSKDKTVRVWNAETGEMVAGPFEEHSDIVRSVAFSPDGKRIVSGSADHTIRIWDVETSDIQASALKPFKGHTDTVNNVVFSRDSKRIVSGSNDGTVRVWDAGTGDTVLGPFTGHTNVVACVAISPDGKLIASGSHDHTIRIWDAETGDGVSEPFKGHTGSVWSVAFSPDGKRIASGSNDRTIRVWDSETGDTVSGIYVAFSPEVEHSLIHINDLFQPIATASLRDYISMENGWIVGPQSQLLFWVPPEHRLGLWWPRNTAVIGTPVTTLDLSRFVHGSSWQECRH